MSLTRANFTPLSVHLESVALCLILIKYKIKNIFVHYLRKNRALIANKAFSLAHVGFISCCSILRKSQLSRMMRIRRKFFFFVALMIVIFLILLYLNANAPTDKSNQVSINYIDEKLKQLENGLKNHGRAIDDIKQSINSDNENSIQDPPQLKKEVYKEDEVIPDRSDLHNDDVCSFNTDIVPNPDVQMLDAYKEIPFDNPDGGAWKQGWNIEYDPHQWNRHHKLKVFVVPHSHNDPGIIVLFAIKILF